MREGENEGDESIAAVAAAVFLDCSCEIECPLPRRQDPRWKWWGEARVGGGAWRVREEGETEKGTRECCSRGGRSPLVLLVRESVCLAKNPWECVTTYMSNT